MPKEMTEDEVRRVFLRKMWTNLDYWERQPTMTSQEKLEGFLHSTLATISGCTDLPSFILAPIPHSSDKEYHIANDEDFYPENHRAARMIKCDIGSGLHSQMFQMRPPEHPVETLIKKVIADEQK